MTELVPRDAQEEALQPEDILVLRRGPGANCSSIGSVLDVLFLSAVAGGAILAAVAAQAGTRRSRAEGGRRDHEPPPAGSGVGPDASAESPAARGDAEPR